MIAHRAVGLALCLNCENIVEYFAVEWPRGFQEVRFRDFMTTALGGGKVVSLTHRPHLPPGNSPGTHFC